MKKYFIITLVAIAPVAFFTACNNNSSKETNSVTKDSANKEESHEEHVYACPMHPEVTGKEGDTCSKCGMKLEHKD